MSRRMWDERYAGAAVSGDTIWSLEPNAFVADTVSELEPGTAVDLGCGEGRNSVWLAEQGWQVTGVDFSSVGLETARRRADQLGLEATWVDADVCEWASPTLVDLVVIAYLQLPAVELGTVIAAAVGWLARGGRVVLVGHAVENLEHGVGGPQDPRLLHDVAALRAAAGDLDVERCETVLRPVGDAHAVDAVLVARRG